VARKVTWTTVITTVTVLAAAFAITTRVERKAIEDAALHRIQAVALTLVSALDPDAIGVFGDNVLADQLERDASTLERHGQLNQVVQKAHRMNGLKLPLEVLRVAPEHRDRVEHKLRGDHLQALQVILSSDGAAAYKDRRDYRGVMAPTFFGKEMIERRPHDGQAERRIAVYAPLTSGQGKVVGMIRVEDSMEAIYTAYQEALVRQVLLLIALSLFATLIMSVVSRRTVRPIRILADAARRFGKGNYDEPIVVESNDEIGTLATILENARTERRRREEELRRSSEEARLAREEAEKANVSKSQFLANMSHELRTPLNAIIGYSEMLQEDASDMDAEDLVPDLQKIHGAGKHLLGLINDILDLSKIEAGRMELHVEEFPLRSCVDDIVTTMRPVVKKNGNEFALEAADDLGRVRADVTKVRQVLFNLLSNAAKFTERGTVTLVVSREKAPQGEVMIFEVKDTGIGMSESQVKKVFEAFTQADASTTRKYGGTGLGLPITRHFCRMMGGEVAVESKDGEGTTFKVTLPARIRVAPDKAPQETPADSARNSEASAQEEGPRVLVIDDDPQVHELMGRVLQKEGIHPYFALDAEEGFLLAQKHRPDLITLDVIMPGEDGWQVLTRLKEDPDLAEIPVIMVSMVTDTSIGYTLGAADFLTKPVDRNRLIALLNQHGVLGEKKSVLVVEDDPTTRQMLRRMLEKEGCRVREAENGRVGLEMLDREAPALVILDLMMPDVDGFGFVEEVRGQAKYSDLPILVVTAKDLNEADRERLSGRVEQIMQKGSYDKDVLLDKVRELVAQVLEERSRQGTHLG
jgi:signal transduction histidine kinase/DNA-binding response OmpR family regulator